MISKKFKCIFVEVPKTGSTSIRNIIGKAKNPHQNILQIKKDLNGREELMSLKQKVFLKTGLIKSDRIYDNIFKNFFKFGFVRNPWDRTVSLYLRNEGIQMKESMTFDEFVNWIQYSSDTCIHPLKMKNQLDWFTDSHGNLLVDYVGRFETLDEEWAYIADKIGCTKNLPYKNVNFGRKHYTYYYNYQTKEIIKKKFQVDIEYFNYEFGK